MRNKARLALLIATAIILSYGEVSACHHYKLDIYKTDIDCVGMIEKFSEIIDEKDSVKCYADSLRASNNSIVEINDSLKRIISENVTAQNMIKSNEFYNDAFNRIQNSVLIFLGLFTLLTAVSVFYNYKFNKYDKRFIDIESKLKEGVENQKNDLKQEAENQRNHLKTETDGIFRKIGIVYFAGAITHLKQHDWMLHFTYLTQYCNFVTDNKIELIDTELDCLKELYSFIKLYEDINSGSVDRFFYKYSQRYLLSLEKLIMYCQDMDKREHLAVVKKLHEELGDVFDSINQKLSTTEPQESPND